MRCYTLSELITLPRPALLVLYRRWLDQLAGLQPGTTDYVMAAGNLDRIRRALALKTTASCRPHAG
jgi:hypothetical protein